MNERALQLLERHLDLLPSSKRPLARWLCEEGALRGAPLPGSLRRRYSDLLPNGIRGPGLVDRLLREFVLELLSQHRLEIARRERVGSDRRIPLGPTIVWANRA